MSKRPAYVWSATEEETQAAIVQALRIQYPRAIVAHIPNEGRRTIGEAMRQARLGLVAGMPDLVVMLPGGLTIWMEVKAAGGRRSKAQDAIHMRMTELGHTVGLVRDIDEARLFVKQAIAMLGERVA